MHMLLEEQQLAKYGKLIDTLVADPARLEAYAASMEVCARQNARHHTHTPLCRPCLMQLLPPTC